MFNMYRVVFLSTIFLATMTSAQEAEDRSEPATDDSAERQRQPSTVDGIDISIRLNPVIVTARRWTEFAQDLPQSITVMDETTLRDAGITSVREASYLIPNMIVTEFSSRRLSFPTFRGISTGIGDPSVTTYVDGVPQLKISSTNISMLDVVRLEFLRGPQGTLYGRSSIGGLIKLETARPTNTPTLRGSTTFGNYDLQEHTLSYSGPIVEDKWFISVSGMYSERDGYTTNTVTGNRVDDRRSTFGRVKILFTPDDRNDIEFTIYNERSRDGGFALGFLSLLETQPHTISEDFEGKADRDILSNSLTWTHHGESVDIVSISSYVDWDIDEESDIDFLNFDGIRRMTRESQEYFYQEFRISSASDKPVEFNNNMSLKWLVGGSLFSSDGKEAATNINRPLVFLLPGFTSDDVGTITDSGDFEDLGLAAFGQVTLTMNENLDLTAGLRFDYEDKDADITNAENTVGTTSSTLTSFSESYDEVVPSFSAALHLKDDAMVYARAAKGFKAGGFNVAAPAGETIYGTETSWTYEAGIKTTWFEERLILNAAVFYIDWDDLQLSLFDPVKRKGFIDNAGQATSTGVEFELTGRVAEGFDIFAGFGYTDAEFDSFVDQFGNNVAGNNLAFVPDTTFNVGAQVNGDLGNGTSWFARGEYVNIGTYQLDAANTQSQQFELTNFRAGVEWNNVRVEGWIRNAFDEDYVLVAFPLTSTVFIGENGVPRTYGVTVSIQF